VLDILGMVGAEGEDQLLEPNVGLRRVELERDLPKVGVEDRDPRVRTAYVSRKDQRASVTFVSPRGLSGSKPFARASAAAKSWPGRTESSGESNGTLGSGTASV
jgi:hypothetical protein